MPVQHINRREQVHRVQGCKDTRIQGNKEVYSRHPPQLLSGEDISGAEEGDAGEAQVLMQHEDTHWDDVWIAQVVDKAADVAIVTCVYAIHLSVLEKRQQSRKRNV